MNRKTLLIVGIILLIGLIVLAVLLFFGIQRFQAYQAESLNPPYPVLFTQITAPEDPVQAGNLVLIGANAHVAGDETIADLTIWINDVPVYTHQAVGQQVAGVFFSWIPTEPGEYTLFARVRDSIGNAADSDLIVLKVLENDIADIEAVPLTADPDYSGPMPGGGVGGEGGDTQPWTGSLGGMLSPESDTLPAAPALVAEVNGCDVTLKFADHSDNEDGFRVYRNLPNISGWKLAETLAPNDSLDFLISTQSGYHGNLGYKVAAFNSAGNAFSNVVSVGVNPGDCPTADLPFLHLQMKEFEPLVPVDNFYCYFNLEGLGWQRSPQEGFIPVGGEGLHQIGESLLTIHQEQASLSPLTLDCWGWNGGELVDLGLVEVGELVPKPGSPVTFGNDFFTALLGFGQATTMDGVLEGNHSMFLPNPDIYASQDPSVCLAKKVANMPSSYCYEADGQIPWPFTPSYVVWDIDQNCQDGSMCYDMFNPSSNVDSAVANAEFGYNVYSWDQVTEKRTFNTPYQMVYTIPATASSGGMNCSTHFTRKYYVTTYMIPDGSQQMFESHGSPLGVFPAPCPSVSGAEYKLNFHNLIIYPEVLEDEEEGEGMYRDVYGRVMIYTDDMSVIESVWFGEGGHQMDPQCPSPDADSEGDLMAFEGRCPLYTDGDINFEQVPLCTGPGSTSCVGSFSLPGNLPSFVLVEGQKLKLRFIVSDDDAFSADDLFCDGEVTLPAWHDGYWLGEQGLGDYQIIFGGSCLLRYSLTEEYTFSD